MREASGSAGRAAALPIAAAIGGMVVPASIYLLVVGNTPATCGWGLLTCAGILTGIGFTMALFVAELALNGALLDAAKIGILGGSAVAGIVATVTLVWVPAVGRAPTLV